MTGREPQWITEASRRCRPSWRSLKHFGIEPTMEEVRKPMGMLKIDHIRTMLKMERITKCWQEKYGCVPADDDAQKLYGHFEEKLLSILDRFADPKPGVVKTVQALRERGIVIGSTTGYNDKMMEIVAPQAAKNGYEPDCMVTPDSVGGMGRALSLYDFPQHGSVKAAGCTPGDQSGRYHFGYQRGETGRCDQCWRDCGQFPDGTDKGRI